MWRHPERFAQHTINPHPHHKAAFIGLDMNVRHALPHGFGDNTIDEADRRGIIGGIEQILGTWNATRQRVDFLRAHRNRRCLAIGRIVIGQQPVESRGIGMADVERLGEVSPDFEQNLRVGPFA